MSLFGTIYNGTTGLTTFSKGLDVISNNVSNLNTPGYKRNDLLFRDMFYHSQLMGGSQHGFSNQRDGNGVTDSGTVTIFSQGDIQQSGNETDVAIDGNGLFILRKDGEVLYTRVGQFKFDADGYLVSSITGARVAGLNGSGGLADINIASLRSSPAQATTEVKFYDNLSSGATSHVVKDIEIYDATGAPHKLTMTLTNNSSTTPRSWLAKIEDEEGDVIAEGLEIRFQGNGSPQEGFNSFDFEFEPKDGLATTISFSFGEPGSFTGATSFSAGSNSDLKVESQNGKAFGFQTKVEFGRDGIVEVQYSNGDSAEAGRLAFAWLNEIQMLEQIGQGLFTIDDTGLLHIGAAGEGVMGLVVGESIEISNVELSQEFTDLVIVQRGYQASSQVVSIANEMIQQLLDTTGAKR